MGSMFLSAGRNSSSFSLDLSGWDTNSVTDMSHMFEGAGQNSSSFSLNLSGWDTSSVTNMSDMFKGSGVKTIYVGDKWTTVNVTSSSYMFGKYSWDPDLRITGGAGTTWNSNNPTDKTYARIDDAYNGNPGYFTDKKFKIHFNGNGATTEASAKDLKTDYTTDSSHTFAWGYVSTNSRPTIS